MINKIKQKYKNQLMDKDFSEILKGSFISFFAKAISVILGVLFSFLITHHYGAFEMGVYSLINSFFSIALIFSMMGFQTAIVRLIPEHIVKYSKKSAFSLFSQVVRIIIFLSLVISIISYLSSSVIANNFFKKEYLAPLLALASYFVIFQALGMLNKNSIRALKKIKTLGLLDVLNAIFKIIFLLLATYLFYSENNPVYTIFAAHIFLFIISSIILYFVFHKEGNDKELIHKESNKGIVTIAFPMFLTSFMTVIISQTDIIMLGLFNSINDVGIYSIAIKVATLTSFVLVAINSIATPKFSELYHAGKTEVLTKIAQKSSKLIFWVSFPIILVFIFFGKYILSIFGEEFIVGYYVLILMSLGQLINGIAGSVGSFLNMTGSQIVFNRIIILGGIVNIILNYLFIPLYGIIGAAIASMISMILWNILASLYIKRKFGFFIGYIPFLTNRCNY